MIKIPEELTKLGNNKYVRAAVLFLSAANILGYLVYGQINAIIFFALVFLVSSHFNKNMTIILAISLILTSLLMSRRVYEGMTTQTPEAENKSDKDVKSADKKQSDAPDAPEEPEAHVATTSVNSASKKGTESMKTAGPRIDYASTIEGAYDNLDKMLGSDGINKLTQDTQKLMSQQQKLFDTMQTMAPALENAKTMLKGFDIKDLGGLSDMLSNATVKTA